MKAVTVQLPLPLDVAARILEVFLKVKADKGKPLSERFYATEEFREFSVAHTKYVLGPEYSDARRALFGEAS